MFRKFLFLCILLLSLPAYAQKKFSIDGRIEGMPVFWKMKGASMNSIGLPSDKLYSYASISNRLNINWYPTDKMKFSAGVRNNSIFGDLVYELNARLDRMYNTMMSKETGMMNLTHVWTSSNNGILVTNLDRLFFQYNSAKISFTLGRQRINWGIHPVWEPNDIFNNFNYLDFNYPERPGSDAVRVQYYTGMTSSLDLAYKLDANHHSTFGAKYSFNQWNTDFQLMFGLMNEKFWVSGFGFSGNLGGAGICGEASYFIPKDQNTILKNTVIASLGFNYMFKNSLFLNLGALFNSQGSKDQVSRSMFTMMEDITPLDYTQSLGALFVSGSYPITPLINLDLTGMMNPFDGSFYFGPSFNFSLSDNVSFYLIAQTFWGSEGSEYGEIGQMYFGRLQWNF